MSQPGSVFAGRQRTASYQQERARTEEIILVRGELRRQLEQLPGGRAEKVAQALLRLKQGAQVDMRELARKIIVALRAEESSVI